MQISSFSPPRRSIHGVRAMPGKTAGAMTIVPTPQAPYGKIPKALHFRAQLNLKDTEQQKQAWYEVARSGDTLEKLSLIEILHNRQLHSSQEAALQSELLSEMAGTPDEAVQQAVLKEAASWPGHLDYEARILEQLARHGSDEIRLGVIQEISRWKAHFAESAVVLKAAAESRNLKVLTSVLKEVKRWQQRFPERALVLKQLALSGDRQLGLAIIAEIAAWDTHLIQQADILKTIAKAGDPVLNHAIGRELNRWKRNHLALVMDIMQEIANPWINGPADSDYTTAGFLPGQLLTRDDIRTARQKWNRTLEPNDVKRRKAVKAALDTLEKFVMDD